VTKATAERKLLADAITMLERLSIIDFNGHCSIRLRDGRILINSGASTRSALTPGDIVAIDEDGALVDGDARPPLEFHIHTELYRRRPDIGAVIHAHPRWSTFFTSAGVPVRPVFAQGCLPGDLPVFPSPRSVNTREMGERVAEAVGDRRGILLKSHGAIMTGGDIVEAFVLAVYLEDNAERQYRTSLLGEPYFFSVEEAEACRANLSKRGLFEKCWNYYRAKFGLAD